MTTRGIDRCARYPPWATTSSRRRTRSPRSWTRLPRSCRSRLPRDVEESRDGKIDGVFTPLPGNFHVGGVERVEGSTARARRGSARRIRRGPLAPGITGRPPGVRSASAGSNVRRGARSTAKIERSRAPVDFHGPSRGFDRVRARRPANISRVRCLPKRGRASGDAVTHGEVPEDGLSGVLRAWSPENVAKCSDRQKRRLGSRSIFLSILRKLV